MTTADERKVIEQQFKQRMDEEELLNCMRCGFCLPSCPTYIESGFQESHSPRGRIALMKAVVDGTIEPDEDVERSLELCLGCRACEPVCPSGVNYGRLLEEARDIIQQNKSTPFRLKCFAAQYSKGFSPSKQNQGADRNARLVSAFRHAKRDSQIRLAPAFAGPPREDGGGFAEGS